MLTTKNLERVIELENNLRTEYQAQLDAKSAEIEQLGKKLDEQLATIEKQLQQITTLSTEATANKRVEQLNRELANRSEKLDEEVNAQKQRIKTLQKDLAEERAKIKELQRFDAVALKKNLDASKKKLAEKTAANDLLQKSSSKYRNENAELQRKVAELEEKLAQFETDEEPETAAA
jgi:chromosome segregation ATPase